MQRRLLDSGFTAAMRDRVRIRERQDFVPIFLAPFIRNLMIGIEIGEVVVIVMAGIIEVIIFVGSAHLHPRQRDSRVLCSTVYSRFIDDIIRSFFPSIFIIILLFSLS